MAVTVEKTVLVITNALERYLKAEMRRRFGAAPPSRVDARGNVEMQTKREVAWSHFDKRIGFWTRGKRIYRAGRSGTAGLCMLVDVEDPFNVIFVKLDTLITRWKHLKELP